MAAGILDDLPMRQIARRAVKPIAQHAQPLLGDMAALGAHHAQRQIGVAPVQVDGRDIGHDLKRQLRIALRQPGQGGQDQFCGEVLGRRQPDMAGNLGRAAHAGAQRLRRRLHLFGALAQRVAVQRYPLVQQYIGALQTFEFDMAATGEAKGVNEFAFALVGDKGRGHIVAEFITVDADTERLGKGVLTLADGRELAFEGEPPFPGEQVDGDVPETFARQDGIFVLQANAAMQAHPVVRRHIGDIREAAFDRDASWAADGERYIFDLKGSKGQGHLEAEFITVDADSERIGEGELVMADGTRYPLD